MSQPKSSKNHVLDFRHPGLTQQREWQSKPDQLSASVFPSWLGETKNSRWQRMRFKCWQMGVRNTPYKSFRWAWIGHERWSQKPSSLDPRLSPFSLWDPAMNATFSSSVNDGVIERLLTMLEVKGPGTFVEIGALNGEIWGKHFLLRITMGLTVEHYRLNMIKHPPWFFLNRFAARNSFQSYVVFFFDNSFVATPCIFAFFATSGTQLGDQCNTRYLRARYNFYGLMNLCFFSDGFALLFHAWEMHTFKVRHQLLPLTPCSCLQKTSGNWCSHCHMSRFFQTCKDCIMKITCLGR